MMLQAEQMNRMTSILLKMVEVVKFWVKLVVILSVAQLVTTGVYFSQLGISQVLNGTAPGIQQKKMRTWVRGRATCLLSFHFFYFYKFFNIYFSFNREETLENNINDDNQKDVEVHKVYDDFFKLTFGITMEQFQYIVIRHNNMIVPLIATTFGWICFKLWGLNVARKARKEILYSESLPATYQRGHGSNHEMAMGITNVSGANRGISFNIPSIMLNFKENM